jgi:SSS family solute:Na+ symporter
LDKQKIRIGYRIIIIAILIGIITAFFVKPYRSLAPEAVYVLVAGFILLGSIIIMNNKLRKMNAKGIIINEGIFKTSTTFNISAIGICGILALLYTVFW